MALHKDFPQSPHAILDPGIRWFPADEALQERSMEKLHAKDGAAAAMVRRRQPGADRCEVRLCLCGRREF